MSELENTELPEKLDTLEKIAEVEEEERFKILSTALTKKTALRKT